MDPLGLGLDCFFSDGWDARAARDETNDDCILY